MVRVSNQRRLREVAIGQHGYVTSADAHALGIPVVELGKLAARKQLTHVAYGLYRFDDMPLTRHGTFFEAVARVGAHAYLTGDAVLAFHELALVNPKRIRVGTPKRVRAAIPEWIEVVKERRDPTELTTYESVPSTTVAAAIESCVGLVQPDRLDTAINEAISRGLIRPKQAAELSEATRTTA